MADIGGAPRSEKRWKGLPNGVEVCLRRGFASGGNLETPCRNFLLRDRALP